MKKGVWAALVACVATAALLYAGSALAAYTPHITITHSAYKVSSGGTTDVTVRFAQTDDPTAKATIYVPQGYVGTLGVAAGTQLGTVQTLVLATQISASQPIILKGTIRADDPAKYAAAATRCTGSPTHDGVWLLALQAAGRELDVPLYVDAVTDPAEATVGKFKLQVCLPSPDIPESEGGAAFGSKVINVTMHLSNVFTLPSQNGTYGWTLVATPYTPGTAAPNPAGTVEARGFVRLPVQLSVAAKYVARSNTYRLTGLLTEDLLGVTSARVDVLRGTSASKLRKVASVRTNAQGRFATAGHLRPRKTTYFRVRVVVPERNTACSGGVPGIRCVSASLNPFTAQSRVLAIKPRRR